MPSTRSLAANLGYARATVAEAYEQLSAEGYLRSHQGRGTLVVQVRSPAQPVVAQARRWLGVPDTRTGLLLTCVLDGIDRENALVAATAEPNIRLLGRGSAPARRAGGHRPGPRLQPGTRAPLLDCHRPPDQLPGPPAPGRTRSDQVRSLTRVRPSDEQRYDTIRSIRGWPARTR